MVELRGLVTLGGGQYIHQGSHAAGRACGWACMTAWCGRTAAAMPPALWATILLDNAAIHKTPSVRAACQDKGYRLLFTPPYSPEFNPIEMVFGARGHRPVWGLRPAEADREYAKAFGARGVPVWYTRKRGEHVMWEHFGTPAVPAD